jgi:hypothetical protein
VVFDGLDEVLVRLDPPDQGLFTRQLFRVVDAQSISRRRACHDNRVSRGWTKIGTA